MQTQADADTYGATEYRKSSQINSVDLELRFWIGDPQEGTSNVKSKVLMNVWDKFKENKIEIPYPQRDLHIRSSVVGVFDT